MPARIGPKRPIRLFIAEWRESRGLTQVTLAGRLGASEMQISRWETGKIKMTTDTLAALAEALDIEPTDFYRHPDTPSPAELLRAQSEAVENALSRLEPLRKARG